jgi:putative ABC transport system permease protein
MSPPPLAERLLAATVKDTDWRDSILGDLREEFVVMSRQQGLRSARRWYWRHVVSIGGRAVTSRFRRAHHVERAWVAPPEPSDTASWFAGFTRDLRHGVRTLLRRPGTSAVIILTLALALATNSTSFAIMDALVLRPYRFPGVDNLVMIVSTNSQNGLVERASVTPGDFRDYRRDASTVTGLSAAESWAANLSGIDNPEQVAGFRVTADWFDTFGVTPVLGREFVSDEETLGNHRHAVLGHALWMRLYGGDPTIVGQTIRLDGEPYDVIGVAPEGFNIPLGTQVWAPLARSHEDWSNRRNRSLMSVGRLAPGAAVSDARAEFTAITERLRKEFPDTTAPVPRDITPFTAGMADPGAGAFLAVMLGASVLLLLIACANIANLLLARGSERTQEFALRLALGAGRGRLAWQLMIEAALLTTLAIALALPIAWVMLGLSQASIPAAVIRFVPGWQYMAISPAVFLSTAAFGAIATVVFALGPALHTVRRDVADGLRQGTRTTTASRQRHWLRNTLAGAQVATTLALLFGSTLLLSAAGNAVNGAFGFDKRDVLVARVVLPERPYSDPEKRRDFINRVLVRLRSIPAVSTASIVSNLPYGATNSTRPFHPDGQAVDPREVRDVHYRRIAPGYLEAMRLPLIAGRDLTEHDRQDTQPVALVSRRLADRYWPNGDALGRQFRLTANGPPITIVGITGDVIHDWFQQIRQPTVYRPLGQDAPFAFAFVVRTVGEPSSIAGDLRRAVAAVDSDQPIIGLQSMEDVVEERTAGLTFIAGTVGVVAFIALALAVMGLYSLMAFMVSRRTQELGVRLALGATRWQVIGVTTGQGVRITLGGLVIGGLAAAGLGRVMESVLFGVVSISFWQLAVLALVVAAISMLASYIPARRTAGLDPTMALRSQ